LSNKARGQKVPPRFGFRSQFAYYACYFLHTTMAPPHTTKLSPKEGSILLATSVFHSGQFKSILAAARAFNIPESALYDRIRGSASREAYKPRNAKLSKTEEQVLVQCIIELDSQGLAPNLELVSEKATAICKARDTSSVGVNWAYKFVKRTPAIEVRLSRSYEVRENSVKTQRLLESGGSDL